jgi:hypothetical protein
LTHCHFSISNDPYRATATDHQAAAVNKSSKETWWPFAKLIATSERSSATSFLKGAALAELTLKNLETLQLHGQKYGAS